MLQTPNLPTPLRPALRNPVLPIYPFTYSCPLIFHLSPNRKSKPYIPNPAFQTQTPTFATQDNTVRLWDLRTPVCQAVLATPGPPVAAFDQQGLVFAVGADSGVIKLFDAANFAKGPFETFVVSTEFD